MDDDDDDSFRESTEQEIAGSKEINYKKGIRSFNSTKIGHVQC